MYYKAAFIILLSLFLQQPNEVGRADTVLLAYGRPASFRVSSGDFNLGLLDPSLTI